MTSNSGGEDMPYVCELTRKRSRKPLPAIRGPQDVTTIPVIRRLIRAEKEHFLILLLNARHECMAVETVSVGSLTASLVHPREVFKPALRGTAAAILLVHNHPSHNPEPSPEDVALTQRIVKAGQLLGIEVLDHVIVARDGAVSLRQRDEL